MVGGGGRGGCPLARRRAKLKNMPRRARSESGGQRAGGGEPARRRSESRLSARKPSDQRRLRRRWNPRADGAARDEQADDLAYDDDDAEAWDELALRRTVVEA